MKTKTKTMIKEVINSTAEKTKCVMCKKRNARPQLKTCRKCVTMAVTRRDKLVAERKSKTVQYQANPTHGPQTRKKSGISTKIKKTRRARPQKKSVTTQDTSRIRTDKKRVKNGK